jgi:hypothetical protein
MFTSYNPSSHDPAEAGTVLLLLPALRSTSVFTVLVQPTDTLVCALSSVTTVFKLTFEATETSEAILDVSLFIASDHGGGGAFTSFKFLLPLPIYLFLV